MTPNFMRSAVLSLEKQALFQKTFLHTLSNHLPQALIIIMKIIIISNIYIYNIYIYIYWHDHCLEENCISFYKMKCRFFQAAVMLILLYRCTIWMLTKRMEKKLDSNYTRMLRTILNKSWRQHITKQQLYGHLPHITKIIKVRWTRHAGRYWRSTDEFISDVLLWIPAHGRAKAGWPAWTYIQQLGEDMGCGPGDLPGVMNDWEDWRERVRDIHAGGMTW